LRSSSADGEVSAMVGQMAHAKFDGSNPTAAGPGRDKIGKE